MSSITFDTHKFVKKLEAAGASPELAEALAEAYKEANSETEVATKRDLRELGLQMDNKLEKLTWMVAALIAIAVANFGKQFF
jgi:hypothetical protein